MAKLIRDRSTPEQDAWWSAVQDAAKTAPKLTYERSANMASEDVLEMLEVFSRKHVDYRNEESAWQEISAIVYALAAEVRELRAKLDSEANHRLSLCADNERFVAEIERLRAELALRKNYADQCRAQDATIHRLKLELDACERAVREARDGVS